jgi:hypothetical protein
MYAKRKKRVFKEFFSGCTLLSDCPKIFRVLKAG